ncbi:MAG: DUF5715 family protein [Terriglobia bacterium]
MARPWTKQFIEHLARAMHEIFGTKLKITSLIRTVATQRSLRSRNGNAAPARGESRSTHLTGASVDISKHPHSKREIYWLRQVLRRLTRQGFLHAIEEFQQRKQSKTFPIFQEVAAGLGLKRTLLSR